MITLNELKKETTNYLILNEGTLEFDMSINDISRAIVNTMFQELGICWIGKINLYGEERKKEYKLTEYTPHILHKNLKNNQCCFIYNFDYIFCLPVYDKKLETMINNRDKTSYKGTGEDYVSVSDITNRIELLKGVFLVWS